MDIRCRYAQSLVLEAIGESDKANETGLDAWDDAFANGLRDAHDGIDAVPEMFRGTPLEEAWERAQAFYGDLMEAKHCRACHEREDYCVLHQ